MTALLRYDVAVAAVAAAATTDEVAEWESKAAAMHEYARRIRDRSVEINMAVLKSNCKRRRGEILRQYREAGLLNEGRPAAETVISPGQLAPVTLEDLAITRNESSECQRIADMDGDSYTRLVARCRKHMEENPKLHTIDVLRAKEGPISGARAIMGSRQEPDDSLDYFPTAPWATRALIERVFPQLGFRSLCREQQAWEPACGEGHISEVLGEYFGKVIATDIHDYVGGDGRRPSDFMWTLDFLSEDADNFNALAGSDWIITNPPFGDKAEAFVLQAIARAEVGVAMFVRQQWLEGVDRYDTIFKPHPPALIAQFSERVPLCKGCWNPTGSTATAYCWVIWLKRNKRGLTEFFWIPPGCKKQLTRADDAERFTAQPVLPRPATSDGHTIEFDPATGEISDDVRSGSDRGPDSGCGDRSAAGLRSDDADQQLDGRREVAARLDDTTFDIPDFLRRKKPETEAAV